MFLNSYWKPDTPGSISQSVFEEIHLRLPQDKYLNLSRFIHLMCDDEKKVIWTHFVFNLREWDYLSHRLLGVSTLNSNKTDLFLLFWLDGQQANVSHRLRSAWNWDELDKPNVNVSNLWQINMLDWKEESNFTRKFPSQGRCEPRLTLVHVAVWEFELVSDAITVNSYRDN